MEFSEFELLLLTVESIISTLKNLEPFLNIYKESLVFGYGLIIVLKTLFVTNALNTAIPLKWTMYCMFIGLLTVVFMKHETTFEPSVIFSLSAAGLHEPSMTFMCIISMTYKPYEFLIDIFTVLCTLYYVIEAYRKEIWKLVGVIFIGLFQIWLTFKILRSQDFDFKPYVAVICFSRLYFYLKPSDKIFSNRLLYFNIVMYFWVLYKGCQHYDRTRFTPQVVYGPDVCMRFQRELMMGKCYLNSSLEFWDDDYVKSLNPSESYDSVKALKPRKSYDSDFGVNFQKVLPVENMNTVKEQKGRYAEMFNYGVTRTDEKNIDRDKLIQYEIEKDLERPRFLTDFWNLEDLEGFQEESFIEVSGNVDERPLNLAHLDEGVEESNQDNSKRNQEERNVDLDNSPRETPLEDKKVPLNENSVLNKRYGYVKSIKKNRRSENKKNNWKKLNYKLESSNNFENAIADFDYIDEVPSKYGRYPDNYSKNRKNKKINNTQNKSFETKQDKGGSWISAEHQAKKAGYSTKSVTPKVEFKVKDGRTFETRARSKTVQNSEQVVNKVKIPKIKQTRVDFKATKHDTPEFEENKIIQTYLI